MDLPTWWFVIMPVVGMYHLGVWAYVMFVRTDPEQLISEDPEEIIATPLEEVVRICDEEVVDSEASTSQLGEYGWVYGINYTPVVRPCFGTFLVGTLAIKIVESGSLPPPYRDWVEAPLALLMLVAIPGFIIGFFVPVPLPRWIYPQWHAARRALRYRERYLERTAGAHDPAAGAGGVLEGGRRRASARKAIPWPPPSWKRRWWLRWLR